MDFKFSPEEEAFRDEVRAFLDENLPARQASQWCVAFSTRPPAHGLHSLCASLVTDPGWHSVQRAWPPVLYQSSGHVVQFVDAILSE